MERLTEKQSAGYDLISMNGEWCNKYCEQQKVHTCNECGIYQAIQKLAQYEDAEEQGLMLKLPCKGVFESSGDTVYYIYDYEIIECVNCGIKMDCEGELWIALVCDEHIFPYRNPDAEHDLDPTDWCVNFTDIPVEEWGKTVFLTQAEAEQKLKEMESD